MFVLHVFLLKGRVCQRTFLFLVQAAHLLQLLSLFYIILLLIIICYLSCLQCYHNYLYFFEYRIGSIKNTYILYNNPQKQIHKPKQPKVPQKMSIILKSDQLNILIYKYLQQCNLSHTAYTFFTQANLEQSLIQYKFDVKSGQLVSLIERALIFNQIQSHITLNNYQECKEPFYLLKSHVCKITEKIKEDKEKLLEELNQNVFSAMRRVSSIHNNLQPNPEYQEIIYEQRATNFLQRIPLMIGNSQGLLLKMSKSDPNYQNLDKHLAAYEPTTQTLTLMTKKQNYINITGILPCKDKISLIQIIQNILIQIFQTNQCQILKLSSTIGIEQQLICFKLPLINNCQHIKPNKKVRNLIAFQSRDQYSVINFVTKRMITAGKGIFEWIDGYNYLVYNNQQNNSTPQYKNIKRYSLKQKHNNIIQQYICKLSPQIDNISISVSLSQIFFFVSCLKQNIVFVYNLDQAQPIYIFDFNQNQPPQQHSQNIIQQNQQNQPQVSQKLSQVTWILANNTDKLIFITDVTIKTFDVQLNNFSKIIQIMDYDAQIQGVGILRKNQEQMYLVGLGVQNLLFYDVSLGKIERVQILDDGGMGNSGGMGEPDHNSLTKNMYIFVIIGDRFELNQFNYLAIVMEEKIYILESSDVEPLFS